MEDPIHLDTMNKSNDVSHVNPIDLAAYCKNGFIVGSSEIYNGLAGFYDFLNVGTELRNNLKQAYIRHFVYAQDKILLQDASIISHPDVWRASGHLESFSDPMLTTAKTKTKIRADHFVEEMCKIPTDGLSIAQLNQIIQEQNLKYHGEDIQEIEPYNLMFNTNVGAVSGNTAYLRPETCQAIFVNFMTHYKTSQLNLPFGIAQIGKAFRNEISPREFLFRLREFEQAELEWFYNPAGPAPDLSNMNDLSFAFLSAEAQMPADGQMTVEAQSDSDGKMETITVQDLVKMGKCNPTHAYWIYQMYSWLVNAMELKPNSLRIREHLQSELSHYSSATFDIDFAFGSGLGFGFKELAGIANRGQFDLMQHAKASKKSMEVFDETTKTRLVPSVIEPSIGVDRLMMAILLNSIQIQLITNTDAKEQPSEKASQTASQKPTEKKIFHCPMSLAPYKVAVFPLLNKLGMPEYAKKIQKSLPMDYRSIYDQSGSIGKRYARQDEIGTPFCVTVDHQSMEDGTVTIRYRDAPTMTKRVLVSQLNRIIYDLLHSNIKYSEL
jgi:glycyl-tRNA synthetase